MQMHRALHDVATRQAEGSLEVEWSENLAMFDRLRNIGGVTCQEVDTPLAEHVALIVPIAIGELIRCELHEHREHVFAFRCQ